MLRSMYSGISGLKNFQTKLDVIGNNISNVNTYGFKKERTIFKDLISQTQAGATGTSPTRGGVNAVQVGLGSQLAAIDTIHNTGSLQTTGRVLDLAISGEGFFMVADATNVVAEGTYESGEFSNVSYTRAGNFYMDKNGYLVNSDGKYLVGAGALGTTDDDDNYMAVNGEEGEDAPSLSIIDPEEEDVANILTTDDEGNVVIEVAGESGAGALPIRIPTTAQSMSVGQDGTVTFVDANGTLRWAGQIVMAKFPNASGLEKTGSNYFRETANSGQAYGSVGGRAGMGTVQSGFMEMSNVDLSEEFTEMIVAQRGFQANSRIITTSDEILQELVNLKR